MPWQTPTLTEVRSNNAAYLAGKLQVPILPNGEVRVLADANAGNAHLNLQYLDWQALQLLPDTAEQQFLDKWANIFLVNADGSRGRKAATYASGTATITVMAGTIFPSGSQLTYGSIGFETTADATVGTVATPIDIRALDAGSAANLAAGTTLSIAVAVAGISGTSGATVVSLAGGTDDETDDELRIRVLDRIRQPPMGGDADDYVAWALEVPGVTRAWSSPREMGLGTVTLRFMMDDLRATTSQLTNGFPTSGDVATVQAYVDSKRTVTGDLFVVAPIPEPINFAITNLVGDNPGLRAAVATSVSAMLTRRAAPARAINGVGQAAVNIPASWVDSAIYAAVGGVPYDLAMSDHVMPSSGSLAVLGTIG